MLTADSMAKEWEMRQHTSHRRSFAI